MPTHNTSWTIVAAYAVAAVAGKAVVRETVLKKIMAHAVEGTKAGDKRGNKVCGPSMP